MNGGLSPTMVAVFVALIGPLLTYLVAARKLSGQIKNSEATELWAESRSIREYATGEVQKLRERITELETRLSQVEGEKAALTRENRDLHITVGRLGGT